jgi:hypothetical protein
MRSKSRNSGSQCSVSFSQYTSLSSNETTFAIILLLLFVVVWCSLFVILHSPFSDICGNINMIKNPLIYEIAMSCIAETVDTFLTFERRIPLKGQTSFPFLEDLFLFVFKLNYSFSDFVLFVW